jgi:hypothetical protein
MNMNDGLAKEKSDSNVEKSFSFFSCSVLIKIRFKSVDIAIETIFKFLRQVFDVEFGLPHLFMGAFYSLRLH